MSILLAFILYIGAIFGVVGMLSLYLLYGDLEKGVKKREQFYNACDDLVFQIQCTIMGLLLAFSDWLERKI